MHTQRSVGIPADSSWRLTNKLKRPSQPLSRRQTTEPVAGLAFERLVRCRMNDHDKKLNTYMARWAYIKADPDGARALLLLLKNGKGTADDFDTMVDRIIESRNGAGLGT